MAGLDILNLCQFCRAKLNFTGWETPTAEPGGSRTHSSSVNVSAGQRIEESFILLDDALAARRNHASQDGNAAGTSNRSLEESFFMVGSASLLRAGSSNAAAPGSASVIGRVQLDPVFKALTRIYEVAADDTKVDQPVCLDCVEKIQKEVDQQVKEVRKEVAAYEAALARLQEEAVEPLTEEEMGNHLKQLLEEEKRESERANQLQVQLATAEREWEELQRASQELSQLEERYWHDFNEFQLQLRGHVEERDALLTRTEIATAQFDRLKKINVYNDVFHIWYDGPFGTISGFHLGRTPNMPTDWDEINAGWGQAVLLLHTMGQSCKMSFSYRLIPMGSYPRIADKKTTYDLFGPVNKFYCTSYDRAMVCFLACLKEFAEFAGQRDAVMCKRETFELPYGIEADKVGGMSIKLMFNKDAKWTKALKYMLTDLKWCVKWMIAAQEAASEQQTQAQTTAS